MASMAQLERALVNAHKAGDQDAARKLASFIKRARQDPSNMIPGLPVTGTTTRPRETSVVEDIVGAGETALTAATGATGGTVGMIGGTLTGIAKEIISGEFGKGIAEEEAQKAMKALTYEPKTLAGQRQTKALGEAVAPLAAVAPLTAEMGAIGRSIKLAAPYTKAAGQTKLVDPISKAGKTIAEKIKNVAPKKQAVGADAVDMEEQRQALANELPVPIKLTKGMKTRKEADLRFEEETAKNAEMGGPLRERKAQINEQLAQNLDEFIDSTGAELTDSRGVAMLVDKALKDKSLRDKTRIREAYSQARKAPEANNKVDPGVAVIVGSADDAIKGSVIDYLNSKPTGLKSTGLLDDAKKYALKLGIAKIDDDGNYVGTPTTVKLMEDWRKEISSAVNPMDPPGVRDATIIKKIIDQQIEPSAGPLYRRARKLRAKFGRDYENVVLIKKLLGTKRGTDDRAIALEDVLHQSVIAPSTSLDTVHHLRNLLQIEGDIGKQAWKELQGGTLRYIKDQALKSVTTDSNGNRIFSPSQLDRVITQLEKSGKLSFIFGKKGEELLSVLNDVAKYAATAPPGVINTSNTAAVLAGLMDVAISGTSGIPAPIMTSYRMLTKSIKDAKLRARIKEALGE